MINFEKAYNTTSIEEFLDIMFPPEWKSIASRILESGVEFGETDKFAPKWSKIPLTERVSKKGVDLETQMKSCIFRVHDCLHQLWGLPIPTSFDEDDKYIFKRAWMCAEVVTLTLTEFLYSEYLFNTQPHIKSLLENRNTILFKQTSELKYKSPKEIAIRLDTLLHKKKTPKWVRDNENGMIFVKDYVPMLEHDRVNIESNWDLLSNQSNKYYLNDLPNQRYNSNLDGLELTSWMIDDFFHLMGTDEDIDIQLMKFNRFRRESVNLPDGWNGIEYDRNKT